MGREEKKAFRNEYDKNLIAKYNRLQEVRSLIYALGWETLDVPIRYGYESYFVLRADFQKSKKAKFYQSLLDTVNKTITCRNSSFTYVPCTNKHVNLPMEHELGYCSIKTFETLNEDQQKYYYTYYRRTWKGLLYIAGYRLIDTYMFVPKVFPHYIYKVKITDETLEKERDEIDHYIESNNLWPRIWRYFGTKAGYKHDPWYRESKAQRIKGVIEEYEKEKQEENEYWEIYFSMFDDDYDCNWEI